ncbi:MAG TPA: hypothetical protein VK920_04480 [Solirubrobacterales bacterium]|nr:hypothetical protein [Solirubrobacterales bacterium]
MRPRYVALALLVGAFAAGAIVACGGDDDEPIVPVTTQTEPSDAATSKGEFVDEADAICEEANAAIAGLADTSAGDPSIQVAQEREIVEDMLDQIESLGTPDEDESTLEDFIDALEELARNLDSQELAAERDDTGSLAELETEATAIRADLATAAQEYGFRECGGEATASTDGTDLGAGGSAGGDTGVAPAPEPAPSPPAVPAPVEPAPAPAPPSGGTGGGTPDTGGDTGGTGGTGGSGGVSP